MGKKKITENNENMKRYTTWYSKDKEQYKKWAESKRTQTKFTQEFLSEIFYKGKTYIQEHKQTGEPLTVSGLQLALGCNKTDICRMKAGNYDWRLFQFMEYEGITDSDLITEYDEFLNMYVDYYIDADGVAYIMLMYSDVIERFYLELEAELEERLYMSNKPNGIIFTLKACFGWKDKPDKENVIVRNTVHVATKEEADRSLKELLTLTEIEEQRNTVYP